MVTTRARLQSGYTPSMKFVRASALNGLRFLADRSRHSGEAEEGKGNGRKRQEPALMRSVDIEELNQLSMYVMKRLCLQVRLTPWLQLVCPQP